MSITRLARSGVVLLMAAGLVGIGTTTAVAAPAQGYVRLAHLSPDTPAVDVYLYSAGKKTPRLVLRHVGYGALSPYQRLGSGSYTVAMRPADAPAASKPVLSTSVQVTGGDAYTVAGMGPYKGIKLKVLNDSMELPAGTAGLRVIAASLKESAVKVNCRGRTMADDVRFGSATRYWTMPAAAAKPAKVRVSGRADKSATTNVKLTAGSLHTVIVLDGANGLKLLELRDSTRGSRVPSGGVDTGLGGMAGKSHDYSLWTFGVLGALAALGMGTVLRRRT